MQRDSAHGRTLWLAVVVLVAGFVLADFVRSPLLPGSGAAALSAPELTLWTPRTEAGGEAAVVARDAAAGLELAGHPTVVKQLPGGTSQAIAELLSRPPRRRTTDLLVLSSTTLASLARDRADRLVPGAAGQAVEAEALLRRSKPLGVLAEEPLALGAAPESGIKSSAELIAQIREAPESCVFGIADDGWSRVQLASLVNRAGIGGNVHFVPSESGALAAQATADGAANLVMAPRGAVRAEGRAGRLRRLDWPFDGGRSPRFWVGLVAPTRVPSARLADLRNSVAKLAKDRGWRSQLAARGRTPRKTGAGYLANLLLKEARRAGREGELARLVERLPD